MRAVAANQLSFTHYLQERRDAALAGNPGKPMSGGAILRARGLRDRSGTQRDRIHREIDTTLRRLHSEARRQLGEREAICVLCTVLALDPDFERPRWVLELFHEYREELYDKFTQCDGAPGWLYPANQAEEYEGLQHE